MTNTIESFSKQLAGVRSNITALKAEEKTLLKEIARLALEESGGDVEAAVQQATDAILVEAPRTDSKAPDPKSKRQRAFRLIQLGWGNKAIAKRLEISASTAATYRADLANGARVA